MSTTRRHLLLTICCLVAVQVCGCRSPKTAWNEKLDYGDFAFVLGEGSGWHGYDVLRIAATGECWYTFAKLEGDKTVWRGAEFRVDEAALAKLRAELNEVRYFSLEDTYRDPNVDDGTQWFVKVRVGNNKKGVYCDNAFPPEIVRLSEFVHQEILEPRMDQFASAPVVNAEDAREPERFE